MGRRGHLFELSFELEEERGFVSLEEGALFSLSDHDAVDGRGMRKQLCLCRRRLERLLLHIVSVRRRRPSWHVRFESGARRFRSRRSHTRREQGCVGGSPLCERVDDLIVCERERESGNRRRGGTGRGRRAGERTFLSPL